MTEDLLDLRCPDCAGERPFAAPPCAEGHEADCPERACTACGAAVLVGAPGALLTLRGRSGASARRELRGAA